MINASDNCDTPTVRVPDMERICNARRKRQQQLKRWIQYDKSMEKKEKKSKPSGLLGLNPMGRHHPGLLRLVQFPQAVILLETAARDDLNEVRKLLSQGVCPNVANADGLTALHQCCIDNNQEMCLLLLRYGADVNARDTEQWTPLHAAATCCHAGLCKILIDNGADLLAVNADGNMPYDICEDETTLNLIEGEMASRGITQEDIDEKRRVSEREMLTEMERLVKTSGDLNQLDGQGAAPLHIAAACGYLDVAGFLLQHGADVDLPDRDGWMAIHVAACWGQYEIIEMLTNFGAKLDTPTVGSGETVFDICEDEKLHERLVLLREELNRWQSFHSTRNQSSSPNGNGDLNGKIHVAPNRRRSSNPRSSSIRRTSMRDKAKLSLKEARQEAETCSLVLPTTNGDSEVEEIVKTPVWMTAVDDANRGSTERNTTSPRASRLSPNPFHRQSTNSHDPLSPDIPAKPSIGSPALKNLFKDPPAIDSLPLSSRKTDSLGQKRILESQPLRPRPSSRLRESVPSNRIPNGAQPASQSPPIQQQPTSASMNGVDQTNVQLHNAYYPMGRQQPPTSTKSCSKALGSPHVLLSTGAKPLVGATHSVIASPLQPGASLTRPPLKRDLLISDSRKAEQIAAARSGKCCILM